MAQESVARSVDCLDCVERSLATCLAASERTARVVGLCIRETHRAAHATAPADFQVHNQRQKVTVFDRRAHRTRHPQSDRYSPRTNAIADSAADELHGTAVEMRDSGRATLGANSLRSSNVEGRKDRGPKPQVIVRVERVPLRAPLRQLATATREPGPVARGVPCREGHHRRCR